MTYKPMSPKEPPLIFSCSGCSDVAQLANEVALRLDHSGVARMSCIAGVGGGVPSLVKLARSGKRVVAVDGCPLHCTLACLENAGVKPDDHIRLHELGLKKHYRKRYDEDVIRFVEAAVEERLEKLGGTEMP